MQSDSFRSLGNRQITANTEVPRVESTYFLKTAKVVVKSELIDRQYATQRTATRGSNASHSLRVVGGIWCQELGILDVYM